MLKLYSFIFFVVIIISNIHASQSVLRIGISSIVSAETNLKMYNGLADYLKKKLYIQTSVIYKKNYKEMNELILKKEVDLSFICTGAYVSLDGDFEILAVPQVEGQIYYRSLLIANKNADIKDIKDLKGKIFAFTDPLSNTGYIYPIYLFIKNNIMDRSFFKKVYYTNSHDKSIFLVNKGILDAAAVDNMIYEYIKKNNPKDVENIRIIHTSQQFPNPPIVINSNIKKDKIEEVFLNMHLDPGGKKILENLHIDKFVKISKSEYETTRKIKKITDEHLKNAPNQIF